MRDDGFTLVEMLVAIALLTLIISGIAGGVQLGRMIWQRDGESEQRLELEAAARALGRLVTAAYPVTAMANGARPQLVFEGREDGCTFVNLSEGTGEIGGLIETGIGLAPAASGQRLMLYSSPYRSATLGKLERAGIHTTQVVAHIRSLRFSYFGPAGATPNSAPTWTPAWSGREQLPQLVTITLTADGRTAPIEISVTVAVRQR